MRVFIVLALFLGLCFGLSVQSARRGEQQQGDQQLDQAEAAGAAAGQAASEQQLADQLEAEKRHKHQHHHNHIHRNHYTHQDDEDNDVYRMAGVRSAASISQLFFDGTPHVTFTGTDEVRTYTFTPPISTVSVQLKNVVSNELTLSDQRTVTIANPATVVTPEFVTALQQQLDMLRGFVNDFSGALNRNIQTLTVTDGGTKATAVMVDQLPGTFVSPAGAHLGKVFNFVGEFGNVKEGVLLSGAANTKTLRFDLFGTPAGDGALGAGALKLSQFTGVRPGLDALPWLSPKRNMVAERIDDTKLKISFTGSLGGRPLGGDEFELTTTSAAEGNVHQNDDNTIRGARTDEPRVSLAGVDNLQTMLLTNNYMPFRYLNLDWSGANNPAIFNFMFYDSFYLVMLTSAADVQITAVGPGANQETMKRRRDVLATYGRTMITDAKKYANWFTKFIDAANAAIVHNQEADTFAWNNELLVLPTNNDAPPTQFTQYNVIRDLNSEALGVMKAGLATWKLKIARAVRVLDVLMTKVAALPDGLNAGAIRFADCSVMTAVADAVAALPAHDQCAFEGAVADKAALVHWLPLMHYNLCANMYRYVAGDIVRAKERVYADVSTMPASSLLFERTKVEQSPMNMIAKALELGKDMEAEISALAGINDGRRDAIDACFAHAVAASAAVEKAIFSAVINAQLPDWTTTLGNEGQACYSADVVIPEE